VLHDAFVNLALSIHGSVLLAAIVAYYKYGDRTELIDKGLRGSDSVFAEMRRRIATELVDVLDEYFQSSQSAPTITSEHDPAYLERSTNPVRSEGFREAVREFVEGHSVVMADYRTLLSARDGWCHWARILSWTLLTLLSVEIAIVGVLGLVDKLAGHVLPDWFIQWSWLPVALLVAAAIVSLPFMLRKHDIMMKCKIRYEVF
jgi:hypothetical protein